MSIDAAKLYTYTTNDNSVSYSRENIDYRDGKQINSDM